MTEQSPHVPLRPIPWDADDAAKAIEEIVADALADFKGERFWPPHPLDEVSNGNSSVYIGAAGVVWGLEYLRREGATQARFDFRPMLPSLLEATRREMATVGTYAQPGSLLLGDLGTALVIMRLAPEPAVADLVYASASANTHRPVRELMWGLPGSMLACIAMAEMTGETRWRMVFEAQAERLLGDLPDTASPIWTQDLLGSRERYLGAVHGYAGNMIPLMRGWEWLTEDQQARVADAVPRTLSRNAWRASGGVTWPEVVMDVSRPPTLCQHCHGAPGMVTTFADAPFTTPELETLLLEGGNFVWAAGPLAKGSNLCHGTGGNGYAFLKLYRRTNDPVWLERARAFAMTAIAQCREAREQVGRGRYSLWTGDVGLAVYLLDCLRAVPRFPTVDVF
jgi:hypothetical protein